MRIRPMLRDAADLARFAACFDKNGSPKDAAVLAWQYLQGPVADTYVDLATDADADADQPVAGIYAVFPKRVKIGDHEAVGVQSLDTMTDVDHRGKGLFKKLAASVYARCIEGEVAFVYGFPNDQSAFGFFNRLGWTRLDPVPFLLVPLSTRWTLRRLRVPEAVATRMPELRWPRRAFRGMATDEEIRVVLGFDEAFDALWHDFASQVHIAVVRDADFLRWRLARPDAKYKTLALYRAGRLMGFVSTVVRSKHGGRTAYIMELMVVPGEHRVAEVLLQHAVDDLRAQGADAALAWCFDHSPTRDAYRAAGFWRLPRRLRPIQLHFGARRLAAREDAAVGNRESWYLSYLDSDTV